MAEVVSPRATHAPSSATPQQSSKKPFSWLSRLYRRPKEADGTSLEHSDGHLAPSSAARMTPTGVRETPVLGVNGEDALSLPPDTSSLRPTISTRVPSIASNQAVVDVDATVDPVPAVSTPDSAGRGSLLALDAAPKDDLSALTPRPSDRATFVDEGIVAPPIEGLAPISANPDAPSSHSSKDSPIPSLFTTRTAETQPTVFVPPPSSIMSGRGPMGAADNASTLTLASSTKAVRRRRSLDTNCSVRALAPASARNSHESERPSIYTEAS